MVYPILRLDAIYIDDIIDLWRRTGLTYRAAGRDSHDSMVSQLTREDTAFFGLFDEGNLIGVVIASSDGRKGWINRLAVDPEYRGQGLAGRLIREGENFLHDLDLQVIAALIEDWNTPSLAAFRKAGYECTDSLVYCSKRSSPDD